MPVDFQAYEPDDERDGGRLRFTKGSNAYKILQFLASEPRRGFTPSEIAAETGVPRGSVGTTLLRLQEQELVRHKAPYWAIGADDRIASYVGMVHGLDAAGDRFGDEDWGDWESTAVDPRTPAPEEGDG